ncbi:hypothetical protein [Lentibacillus sp. CBA3610]|uniref:hypothetical protein n=1 Tax=Lentibacillus sp. CBA3610 TaxID=2518176 RepID=UPI001594EFCC|nr:hypothetical protein [Lentibacillus sp. CBA3610]QKY70086.1 hypothetical protein Len3610_11240 [Lentibacillus sp. CBA3610]
MITKISQHREFILTDGDESLGFVGLFDIEQRHRMRNLLSSSTHQETICSTATKLAMDYAFSV